MCSDRVYACAICEAKDCEYAHLTDVEIEEFHVYDRALTSEEIAEMFRKGRSSKVRRIVDSIIKFLRRR